MISISRAAKILRPTLLTLFSAALIHTAYSQTQYNLSLIDSARVAYCKNNKEMAIHFLRQYVDAHPSITTAIIAEYRLGELLAAENRSDEALLVLQSALEKKSTGGLWSIPKDSCGLFQSNDYDRTKARICITISNIFETRGDEQKALHYLMLADSDYLPYQSCGNGMQTFRTGLSLTIADYYLRKADTAAAINRLLHFFLPADRYSNDVGNKLTEILLEQFSTREIVKTARSAIKNIRKEKREVNGEPKSVYILTLFSVRQVLPYDSYSDNVAYLRQSSNMKALLDLNDKSNEKKN